MEVELTNWKLEEHMLAVTSSTVTLLYLDYSSAFPLSGWVTIFSMEDEMVSWEHLRIKALKLLAAILGAA